ncbi:MAG: nucleotide exchange factor GrpE [Clostridia bacterium]|nr:nucleotide exchange factor GrpE [Clostridia bacterium]MDE7329344.1 nucleotide exchange factor GrpE [Clostridia bacterium]
MSKKQKVNNEEEVLEFQPQINEGDKASGEEDEKFATLNAQYIRLQADFENFKKRNAATASLMYTSGVSDVIVEILPVIDYLDMAINAQKDEEQRKGIELVKNAFVTALDKFGVSEFDPIGEEFDPNKHEAVMQRQDDENSGKIVEVVKKGYQRDGKILRHPMVVVAE